MEGSFSMNQGDGGGDGEWLQDDSSALCFLCTLFLLLLHQFHLRSSGILEVGNPCSKLYCISISKYPLKYLRIYVHSKFTFPVKA